MKTKYMKPTTGIHSIELTNICASSPAPGIQEGPADTSKEQDGGGYMLSRRSLWDDED